MFGAEVPTVRVGEVAAEAYLLDVRDDDEWAAGHAPAAHHLPMRQIPGRRDEVPRTGDVVVVCRVGARSAQVVAYLMGNGWTNVRNLAGGMAEWAAAGRPLVSDGDAAARII